LFRLANNYKMLEQSEFKDFISTMVTTQMNSAKEINIKFLEALISIGYQEQAYRLIQKCDINLIKDDKQIMSIYLNLLCEKDMVGAAALQKDLLVPSPSDIFEDVETKNLSEEECIQKLMDDAMPEKTKERKMTNVMET
jgi:AICAR transformylase/IMP cyclohydrolase PurH